MQTEISKMSDEELWNDIYSLFEFERSPEGLRHYKIWNELKKRLSKNNIEDKTLNKRPNWYNGTRQCIEANIDRPTPDSMNNIMAHIQTLVEFELRDNIEEFKKKLIEEIEKSYFIPSNKEDQNIIKKLNPLFETYKNKIIDLINN